MARAEASVTMGIMLQPHEKNGALIPGTRRTEYPNATGDTRPLKPPGLFNALN